MNGFSAFWLVVGLIFLVLIVVAVMSDRRACRRRGTSYWEPNDALRSGSTEYSPGASPRSGRP